MGGGRRHRRRATKRHWKQVCQCSICLFVGRCAQRRMCGVASYQLWTQRAPRAKHRPIALSYLPVCILKMSRHNPKMVCMALLRVPVRWLALTAWRAQPSSPHNRAHVVSPSTRRARVLGVMAGLPRARGHRRSRVVGPHHCLAHTVDYWRWNLGSSTPTAYRASAGLG